MRNIVYVSFKKTFQFLPQFMISSEPLRQSDEPTLYNLNICIIFKSKYAANAFTAS